MQIRLDYLLKSTPASWSTDISFHLHTGNFEQNNLSCPSLVNEFNDYRTRMNAVILSKNNLVMKRLWNLDTNTYENGALATKTKEMPGLVVRRGGCFVVMIVLSTISGNAMK